MVIFYIKRIVLPYILTLKSHFLYTFNKRNHEKHNNINNDHYRI